MGFNPNRRYQTPTLSRNSGYETQGTKTLAYTKRLASPTATYDEIKRYLQVRLIDITSCAITGPGLVFIVYPEGIAQLPVSPLWSILFMLMLINVGIGSQVSSAQL